MKTLTQIIICIALGSILGIAFWLCDGGKTRPKVSKGQEWASQAQEMPIKVYDGEWHKDFLEVMK